MDEHYFTLVFKGDITTFQGNPHMTDTPFGRPVASGIGNAFDMLERLHEIENKAAELADLINQSSGDQ